MKIKLSTLIRKYRDVFRLVRRTPLSARDAFVPPKSAEGPTAQGDRLTSAVQALNSSSYLRIGVLCVFAAGTLVAILAAQESTSRSVWDGVYNDKQAMRGEALYSEQCARCHGAALTGGEEAPPLVGGAFQSNWNGLTLGDLFDRIRGSMPADQPGKLRREQVADILAHVLRVNEFPVGSAELEYRVEFLKQIRFEAVKPDKRK
jgi:mono/diheme cytochrome c family protein